MDYNNNNTNRHEKVKHLVEINDNILAVFIIESLLQVKDIHIAKNSDIDKSLIEKISEIMISDFDCKNKDKEKYTPMDDILGFILWDIFEYNKLRILKIYEKEKVIVVLINSNTKLEHTIDNILGYYFDTDDNLPKSLF